MKEEHLKWQEWAKKEQERLAKALEEGKDLEIEDFNPTELLFTFDVQYVADAAFVGIDVSELSGKHCLSLVTREALLMPYFPGYFAFREGPVILSALKKAHVHIDRKPALLLLDGHGTAHPRKMGVACWVGIKSSMPSMGVAKEPLLKKDISLGLEAGNYDPYFLNGEIVGFALRTQRAIKPVFVSGGYKISQTCARKIATNCVGKYRNLEPIRRADQAARAYSKNAPLKGSIVI